MKAWTRSFAAFLTTLFVTLVGDGFAADAPDSAGITFFETKIRPVLVEHCLECHGPSKQRGDLRLDSKAGLLKGGDSGAAIVPGQAEQSLLIRALRHEEPKMPPKGKLTDAVIADFVKWINQGAPDPRDESAVPVKKAIDWAEAARFWSFQPPTKHAPPPVADAAWPQGPIDHFLLARLEAAQLRPVKPAGKRELLRRATFDLTGLPPTPEETDAFLADDSPQAFEKVVRRLLDSPHYGERWGRHWLDVARYAEDHAHTFGVKPNTNAWRYRDWVIQAFNDDLPYDRFVKLQLAADLIETDEAARLKHLPALGFMGLGAQYYKDSALTAALAAADELDDRVDALTRGFLGLTVSCARCHDHKYDPIPQLDYYSLSGVFSSCKLVNLPLASAEQQAASQAHQAKIKKVQTDMQTLLKAEKEKLAELRVGDLGQYLPAAWQFTQEKAKNPKLTPKDHAAAVKLDAAPLDRCVKLLQATPVDPLLADWPKLGADDGPRAAELATAFEKSVRELLADRAAGKTLAKPQTELLRKLFGEGGAFDPSDAEVKAKLPAEVQKSLDQFKAEVDTLQRDDAAKPLPEVHAITDATPADAKVNVRGSPLDLGAVAPRRFLRIVAGEDASPFTRGSGRLDLAEAIASPTNPLTARVIVNRVWQQHFGRALAGTPSNLGQLGERPSHPELLDDLTCRFVESGWSIKWLHREIMLSAAYRLSSDFDETNFGRDGDNRLYWRMNRRRLDIEAWRDAMLAVSGRLDPTLGGPTVNLSQDTKRRTVYAKISRHNLDGLLRLFDFPDANITSERRSETTVPQQQLFVMNSAFVTEMARGLATRMNQESGDDAAKVRRGYRLAYSRAPEPDELRDATAFLAATDLTAEQSSNRLTRWERLAQVLLAGNEFLYVD